MLEEIHENALKKRKDIDTVVKKLVDMMRDPTDAVQLLPLIKDLYKVGVENDEQVVKVATIVQRLISADSYNNKGDGGDNQLLSEDEKDRLLNNALSELGSHMAGINETVTDIKDRSDAK